MVSGISHLSIIPIHIPFIYAYHPRACTTIPAHALHNYPYYAYYSHAQARTSSHTPAYTNTIITSTIMHTPIPY